MGYHSTCYESLSVGYHSTCYESLSVGYHSTCYESLSEGYHSTCYKSLSVGYHSTCYESLSEGKLPTYLTEAPLGREIICQVEEVNLLAVVVDSLPVGIIMPLTTILFDIFVWNKKTGHVGSGPCFSSLLPH